MKKIINSVIIRDNWDYFFSTNFEDNWEYTPNIIINFTDNWQYKPIIVFDDNFLYKPIGGAILIASSFGNQENIIQLEIQ